MMPKDATKNVDRYKIGGGHLNEYEFERDKATDKRQKNTDKKSQKSNAPQKSSRKAARKKQSK